MLTIRKSFLFFIILSFLVGCGPVPTLATPSTATPEPITVALSPMVGESEEHILRTCAWGLPQIVLLTKETQALHPDPAEADLTLWWGIPTENPILTKPDVVAVQLGTASISLVVHQDNALDSLTAQQVQDIFTARMKNWGEVSEDGDQGEIQVLAYPNDTPFRHVFDNAFLSQDSLSPFALLVPSPAEVVESIEENPAAIGYLPSNYPLTDVKTIPLQASSPEEEPPTEFLSQPLLGIMAKEPNGNLAALVHCLETNSPSKTD